MREAVVRDRPILCVGDCCAKRHCVLYGREWPLPPPVWEAGNGWRNFLCTPRPFSSSDEASRSRWAESSAENVVMWQPVPSSKPARLANLGRISRCQCQFLGIFPPWHAAAHGA